MTLGFIIIRHVNSKITDYYWKECYFSIRKFYNSPILIIDDSSNVNYLNENILLTNCTVIYDKEYTGRGEFLPYYYFHLLKPFDTAVILHDSMFIQSPISFELHPNEPFRFLWSIPHYYDNDIITQIHSLINSFPNNNDLLHFYGEKTRWHGSFGVSMILNWSYLDEINKKCKLFDSLLPKIINKDFRCGLERIIGLIFYYYYPFTPSSQFGCISNYTSHGILKWDTRFTDYLTKDYSHYPIVKVWTGR